MSLNDLGDFTLDSTVYYGLHLKHKTLSHIIMCAGTMRQTQDTRACSASFLRDQACVVGIGRGRRGGI